MLNNIDFYRPFIVSSEGEVPSEPVDELTALNTFLDNNSQEGTWIDEITIVALANGLVRHGIIEGAIFMIFKERGTEWVKRGNDTTTASGTTFYFYYTGDHYDALIPNS
jgi:hypothetical protein